MRRFLLAAIVASFSALPIHADGYWAGEGFVVPKDGVTLRTRSTQLVSKVLREVGDQVKKGDVILQFDDRNAKIDLRIADLNLRKKELELKLATARMEIAKATVARAQSEMERVQKLLSGNVITKEEVARKEADYASARAELTATEVQVEIAKIDVDTGKSFVAAEEAKIDELSLKAPFDGLIVARYTAVGEWISKPDQSLIDLVGSQYLIEASVPSRLISQLNDKTPMEVALDKDGGEKTFKVKVAVIAPVIDPRTKTMKVQFSIPESIHKTLKPGMTVAVKIGVNKGDE